MKIAFVGSSSFAVPALHKLIESGESIPLVVTKPDKPAGRGLIATPTAIKKAALENRLNVIDHIPTKQELIDAHIEKIVVASYGNMIPDYMYDDYHCLNIHPSLLPKYRGPSPIQSALLNGDTTTGVTIMLISKEMDVGDIIRQEQTMIDINETSTDLENRLAMLGAELLHEALHMDIDQNRVPQDNRKATYCKKITSADSALTSQDDPKHIHNIVRAITGYIMHKGKRVKILQTLIDDNKKLSILYVQPEGKNKMTYDEFVRGYGPLF